MLYFVLYMNLFCEKNRGSIIIIIYICPSQDYYTDHFRTWILKNRKHFLHMCVCVQIGWSAINHTNSLFFVRKGNWQKNRVDDEIRLHPPDPWPLNFDDCCKKNLYSVQPWICWKFHPFTNLSKWHFSHTLALYHPLYLYHMSKHNTQGR